MWLPTGVMASAACCASCLKSSDQLFDVSPTTNLPVADSKPKVNACAVMIKCAGLARACGTLAPSAHAGIGSAVAIGSGAASSGQTEQDGGVNWLKMESQSHVPGTVPISLVPSPHVRAAVGAPWPASCCGASGSGRSARTLYG